MARPRKIEHDVNAVGETVARIRKQRGLTIAELTAMFQVAGFSIGESGVSRLERRIRVVRDTEILLICRALNISVIELLGTKSDGFPKE